jgi:anti-anti-sigma factor
MTLSWSEVETETTDAINKIKQSKNNAVMVDMAAMETINSGLVASLVRIWKTMQQRKGRFSLVSSNEMVTDVLKTAGLWKLWTIVDERDEAVYQLGAGKVAEVEQRERRVLALVAVPCALLSLLAFAYMHASESLSAAVNAQVTSLLLAAAAMATGLLSVFKDAGVRRYLSVGAVVVSGGVLAASQLQTNPIGAVSDYLNEVTDSGDAVGGRWRRTDGTEDEGLDELDLEEPESDDSNSDSVATDDKAADGDRSTGPSEAQAKPISETDAQTTAVPSETDDSPDETSDESAATATNRTETNTDDVRSGASEGDVIGADKPLP